jgi:hypothetical protein
MAGAAVKVHYGPGSRLRGDIPAHDEGRPQLIGHVMFPLSGSDATRLVRQTF